MDEKHISEDLGTVLSNHFWRLEKFIDNMIDGQFSKDISIEDVGDMAKALLKEAYGRMENTVSLITKLLGIIVVVSESGSNRNSGVRFKSSKALNDLLAGETDLRRGIHVRIMAQEELWGPDKLMLNADEYLEAIEAEPDKSEDGLSATKEMLHFIGIRLRNKAQEILDAAFSVESMKSKVSHQMENITKKACGERQSDPQASSGVENIFNDQDDSSIQKEKCAVK